MKKTNHKAIANSILTISALSLCAFCFQNWAFLPTAQMTQIQQISSIDQVIRTHHARELLGKYYRQSEAKKAENLDDLHLQVFATLNSKLPATYKNQALELTELIIKETAARQMDPFFVLAVIETESKFNVKARGLFGEIGLMQIKPDTAAWIAPKYGIHFKGKKSLENPGENIRLGIAYFSHLRSQFKNQAMNYVTAYNMGPAKLRKMIAKNVAPQEYAQKVMGNYRSLYEGLN